MPFNNPKQRIAAILAERKKTLGPVPKNVMAPMNLTKSTPNLVPPSPIAPPSNPMAPAMAPLNKGKFGKIKSKFGGF